MYLTVKQYDSAEQQALLTAPNRIDECCMPITFLHESYPVRISSERAAVRYVDVMQDGRTEDTFALLIGAFPTRRWPSCSEWPKRWLG